MPSKTAQARPDHPKRIPIDLSEEQWEMLRAMRTVDASQINGLVRAMVEACAIPSRGVTLPRLRDTSDFRIGIGRFPSMSGAAIRRGDHADGPAPLPGRAAGVSRAEAIGMDESKKVAPPRLTITASELAACLSVSPWTIYQAAKRGELDVPPLRIGRRMVWSRQRIAALLGADPLTGEPVPFGEQAQGA